MLSSMLLPFTLSSLVFLSAASPVGSSKAAINERDVQTCKTNNPLADMDDTDAKIFCSGYLKFPTQRYTCKLIV